MKKKNLKIGYVYYLNGFTAPKVYLGTHFECLITDQKISIQDSRNPKDANVHIFDWDGDIYKNDRFDYLKCGGKDPELLKRFMNEFFDFKGLVELGLFKKEMKGDYYAQAKRICHYFGYETIFEYGAKKVSAHISYVDPKGKPFVEEFGGIYED
jgi:hypothetical protein